MKACPRARLRNRPAASPKGLPVPAARACALPPSADAARPGVPGPPAGGAERPSARRECPPEEGLARHPPPASGALSASLEGLRKADEAPSVALVAVIHQLSPPMSANSPARRASEVRRAIFIALSSRARRSSDRKGRSAVSSAVSSGRSASRRRSWPARRIRLSSPSSGRPSPELLPAAEEGFGHLRYLPHRFRVGEYGV